MLSLSPELIASLVAALIGLYYYITAQIAQGKANELKADLQKALNTTANKDIDAYIQGLQERTRKAREDYEKSKTDTGFLGPTDGNA